MTAFALDEIPTGVALVAALTSVHVTSLDEATRLEHLRGWERVIAWATAMQNLAIVAHMGSGERTLQVTLDARSVELIDTARTELASVLHWSEQLASSRIDQARALHADLPATTQAMTHGRLSPMHVRAIVEGAARLTAPVDEMLEIAAAQCNSPAMQEPPSASAVSEVVHACVETAGADADLAALRALRHQLLTAYEQRVVTYATSHTVARSREQLTRTINRLDPDGLSARRALAQRTKANVSVVHGDDGMSTLTAVLPTEMASACIRRINALVDERRARANGAEDRRPIGLERALAFSDLLLDRFVASDNCPSGEPSSITHDCEGSAPAVHVDVMIDLASLLGLQSGTATLDGGGTVPAEVVRDLILDDPRATMRRVITDPVDGHLVEVGTHRYEITGRLREYLIARDQRCRYPDCGRRAEFSDIDHAVAWDAGGASTPSNLGALCRQHHTRKTHAGYAISESQANGACSWTTPSGLVMQHDAVDVRNADDDPSLLDLHEQLRTAREHIERAQEEMLDPMPHISARIAAMRAMDEANERSAVRAIRRSSQLGAVATIVELGFEHHRQLLAATPSRLVSEAVSAESSTALTPIQRLLHRLEDDAA